jgi:hypothetical protein
MRLTTAGVILCQVVVRATAPAPGVYGLSSER